MSDSGLPQSPASMGLQQEPVDLNRWSEEADILLECTSLTLNNSKELLQEIKESPFENTIYNILTELFDESENVTNLMETTHDSTGITANMRKMEDILEREHITGGDDDTTICMQFDEEEISSTTQHAYKAKLSQIKQLYDSEHQKLDTLCKEYEEGMMRVFRDHPECIPISQDKVDTIIQGSMERSQFIHLELKTNVAEAVLSVKKGMLENRNSKRRKRNFSKQATEILNEYFYSNIDNPYPCDKIKSELAAQCSINLAQVNNWFGNKRIRYKRNIGKENNGDSENKSSATCDSGIGLNEDVSSSEDELDYAEATK
ncbi:pre-B-cell leukemia homeobox (Pbx) transcription factor [Oopsacas minuta]|uniref:Pre-B-cell leukemia homeobox (Pbx) transcription factor n=1 Tax=Oopsacas minuta TaxID=111878 RepID=A0AAV7K7D8_9METZ|nr:pre-B-cell leukemia homeobox (Pbx) transcription factor [Oopsacas minuta]